MSLWNEKRRILITCARGTPGILAGEIQAQRFPVRSTLETAVETEGTLADTLRLNLSLRTAQRVLYPFDAFPAGKAQDLHQRLVTLPWEKVIAADGFLSVTSSVDTAAVNDSRFANVKTKDAIVDRIREKQGRRPDSGPGRHGAVVHLHWEQDRCEVWLDTSGEPLSRRGYRKIPSRPPCRRRWPPLSSWPRAGMERPLWSAPCAEAARLPSKGPSSPRDRRLGSQAEFRVHAPAGV